MTIMQDIPKGAVVVLMPDRHQQLSTWTQSLAYRKEITPGNGNLANCSLAREVTDHR